MRASGTAKTMHPYVGLVGHLNVEDWTLKVQVRVQDVRSVWGSEQYLVTPVTGSGSKWVAADRVTDLVTPANSCACGRAFGSSAGLRVHERSCPVEHARSDAFVAAIEARKDVAGVDEAADAAVRAALDELDSQS